MTLADFILALEDALKTGITTQTGDWSNAQATARIHDGHMKLFTLVANQMEDFCEQSANLTETANTQAINLPLSLFRLTRLERVLDSNGATIAPIPLERVTKSPQEVQQYTATFPYQSAPITGTPVGFSVHGQKKIKLYPTPVVTQTNSLQVTYIQRPAKMVTSTSVPFQNPEGVGGAGKDDLEEFHDLIWLYALAMMQMKEESASQAQFFTQLRMEREQELRTHLRAINAHSPKKVAYTGNWDA